jgi:subtilisin family serine protease
LFLTHLADVRAARWRGFVATIFVFLFASTTFAQLRIISHNGLPVVADEVIVRLRAPDNNAVGRVRNVFPGAQVDAVSEQLSIHVVRAPGQTVQDLLQTYSNHPDVLYAEPNYIVSAVKTPNDALYSSLWGMTKIGAASAWNLTTGKASLVVGIIDSGVDYNHPDLVGNIWSAPAAFTLNVGGVVVNCAAGTHGFNAITKSCDPLDDLDHGTHVAGSIGATGDNTIGVAGVNWTTRIMALKFLDSQGNGSTSNAISAVEFAREVKNHFAGTATPVDIRVLSNSWGGGGYSQSLLDQINFANADNILFVAAAGNYSSNNDILPFYPATYNASNVISVAATTSSDALAGFSNYGAATVDLGAPGQSINSTLMGGGYTYSSGTSMATPYVAGAALLTLAACPSLSTLALRNAILNNVDILPSLQGKTITGGRLNVDKAVRSCVPTMPLVSSLNPAFVGTSVTFTATVTGASPSGTVNFTDGGNSITGCTAVALSGSGNSKTAACTTTSLGGGAHAITGYYSGDTGNAPKVSVPLTQTINSIPGALVGHWALDETSGNTASDSSGNNNPGALINGPVWDAAGKIGRALSFDGTNDYVSLGNPAVLIPGSAITLASWVKLNSTSSTRFIISKYDGLSPSNDTFLRYQASTGMGCSIGGTPVTASTSIVAGQWYHVACTYDGANIKVYVNGAQIVSLAKTGAIADEVGTSWLIGARTPATPSVFMHGLLDDVRIYNFALSAAEISVLNNPPQDTTPPLLSNGAPTGTLPAGTTQTTLSLTTDENATCRYATVPGTAYASMTGTFSTSGTTAHSTLVSSLSGGNAYTFYVRCLDTASNANTTDYAIAFSVTPSDTTPPILSNGAPTGTLPAGTTQSTLSLTTSENSTCRYATVPGTAYSSMSNLFSTTGNTLHSTLITGLSGGNTYTYYVRCLDSSSNANTTDYAISFSVTPPDTTPPILGNGLPTGALPIATTQTSLSLITDENATCRYSTVPGTPYASMPNTFSSTGGMLHSTLILGLSGGNTYTFYVRCSDAASNATTADYAISFSVIPSDTTPAVLSNGSPAGSLSAGTIQAMLSLATNENASCRYATVPGTPYASMPSVFSTTGAKSHSTLITGLAGGNTYTFYVRCLDAALNANTTDFVISFSVANSPVQSDLTTGLAGLWAFNETSGTTAVDFSGHDNTGILLNGPSWDSAGRIGGALLFDGVNDYVSLGNPASMIPGNAMTLAGWMKFSDVSVNRFVISKYDGLNPQTDTFLRFTSGQGITCSFGGTSVIAHSSIAAGQWYHAACTYDGSIIRVYLNGAQVATLAKTGLIADEVGTDWLIGSRNPANPGAFMKGLLDDVRVYNRALSAVDITQLNNLPLDTTSPILSNGAPSGTLPVGTTQTTLSLATDEIATCRYATVPGTAFASMIQTFSTTAAASHSTLVTGLFGGNTYTFYVRCLDVASNANTTDFTISFYITPPDTTPPVLSNGAPSGTLPVGTTQTAVSLTTDENSTCRYSVVPGTSYPSMPNTFSATGTTAHSTVITGLLGGNTYTLYVRCLDAASNANTADYAISFSVIPPDTTPPVLGNGSPAGTLSAGTTQATLSLTTNENATCRYATVAGTAYASMLSTFSTTGSAAHSTLVTGLSDGNTYTFFSRCLDTASNANTTDFTITFSVASTPPPYDITTGLKGHWALNETSGNTASDSSGNNNAGALINGPAWSGAGRIGGALSFDGVNDYVSLGNPASLIPANALTMASWVKVNDTSANRFFISKYDGIAPHADTYLRYQAGKGIMCAVGGTAMTATATIAVGQWYHAACTYDGATIRVYLNGVQIATAAKTGPIADEAGTDWLLGARTPASPAVFMKGLMDDVRIYDRALTAADIAQLNSL